MSSYYEKAYQKRLNRYGLDYQSRIQSQREKDFNNYLYKTIYRVDFEFKGEWVAASLERYKQDYTETQGYLLTKTEVIIPNGTVVMIQSKDGSETPWMIWWLEKIESSGYNRYIVLKMTHYLEWKHNGEIVKQWGYFTGPGNSTIEDVVQSATGKPLYRENNNLHMFITTQNETIDRGLYFEVKQGNIRQGYEVKAFDINSTPGVNYVSVDPVLLRDETQIPDESSGTPEQFFWL